MRTIKLPPNEFKRFKELANAMCLFFEIEIVKKGLIYIVADSQQLETIGY